MMKTVVVVAGPTGIGKTRTGLALAKAYSSVIISADSRQIYREIPIGTAAPTPEEQAEIPHFLVGTRSVFDYYNAFEFEQDALRCVQEAFVDKDVVRSEEHTSELQSRPHLVCRLLLEKKKKYKRKNV